MADPTADHLERLLADALGRPVRVVAIERPGGWAVWRCRLEGTGAPPSVIVKGLRENTIGFRTDPRQMANEAAALTFLAELGFAAVPRLVGADLPANVLVLEDLAPRMPLDEQLRGRGAAALEAERLAFARTAGDLAAATVGRQREWEALRIRFGEPDSSVGLERGLGPLWAQGRPRIEAAGLAISGPVEADLGRALGLLADPGPFLAMTNGDPEANNFLTDGVDGRLIDFEAAAFRHALTAATWFLTPGPGWMVVADPIAVDLETAYRRALAVAAPEAQDDALFGEGLSAACLVWTLERLARIDVLDRRPAGEPSRPQMISTLEAAAAVGRRHRALPHLTGWAEHAAGQLRRRWPDADVDLTVLPPYTPRG